MSLWIGSITASGRVGYSVFPTDTLYRDWAQSSSWYVDTLGRSDSTYSDVFYLVSTNVISSHRSDGQEVFVSLLDSADRVAMTTEISYLHTHCFPDSFRFYAPYYQQVTMHGLLLPDARRVGCYQHAAADVIASFNYYMTHLNHGRSFILAGFSQGAWLVLDLVKHLTPEQLTHLVGAYVIGYGISQTDLTHPNVKSACNADDRGVCISFNTVRDTSCIWPLVYNNAVTCINPVNWRVDASSASFDFHGQRISVTLDTTKNVLLAPDFKPTSASLYWPEGAWHLQDLLFYIPFLRLNALHRTYDIRL